ncbi:MAG TPA: hypothetical protein VFC70_05215 [Oscillospiraceae bacterium]|nr:hypothetical protein [Oscillospiraceae bacterium]
MTRRQSIFTLASVYIGTVIGAGFASGQEILQFFGKYGYKGILGVIVITILFSLLGILILNSVYMRRIHSLEEFITIYFGKAFFVVINIILIFLLFISYVVMLSGSGATLNENFQVSYMYGIFMMTAVTFYVFIFGIRGIANANNIVVPFLILTILWVGIVTICKNKILFSNFYTYPLYDINLRDSVSTFKFLIMHFINKNNWLWSAVLYVAFNSIGVMVVMPSLKSLIVDRKAAVLGGILGGAVLGVLAMVILISLLILHTDIIGIEVPMIAVAGNLGAVWKQIYSVVLLLAMFTTAIANGYGCILGISNLIKIDTRVISVVVCIISMLLATLGFKKLVTFFYPLFGYIGMILICTVILKNRRKHKGFY